MFIPVLHQNSLFSCCIFILLLLNSAQVIGQSFIYPVIQPSGETVKDFIPAGWDLLESAEGDLNSDGAKDVAFVIEKNDSAHFLQKLRGSMDTIFAQPRILVIAMKNEVTENLYIAEQSNIFILPHDDPQMDEPFQILAIEDGILQIGFQFFHNIGSWYILNLTYNFKYQNHEFQLLRAEKLHFHRATHDYSEFVFDFIENKWSLKKGNDNREEDPITEHNQLNIEEPATIKTIEQPNSWEVAKDVYL